MPKQNVYYNYEPLTIPGLSTGSLNTIIESKYPAVITNIKYNDEAYFMQKMYFHKPSPSNSTVWLVLQHNSDPNMNAGKTLYLAAQIEPNGKNTDTGIDTIFKSINAKNIELTINNDLTDGGNAKINESNGKITIALTDTIKVTTADLTGFTFYASTIVDLNLDTSSPNALMRKSILDWAMSCEMVGEGSEDKTEATKPPTSDLMDNINMIMAMVLIVGALNIAAPEIYKYVIGPILVSNNDNKPITSLHLLWAVSFGLLIMELIIFGASGKGASFYYLALMLMLMWVSIDKSLSDNLLDGGSKANLINAAVINVGGNVLQNDRSYFSIFPSFNDYKLEFGVKLYCVLSMLGLWSSNFNIIADQNMNEGAAFQKFLTTFPNYFLYALTITFWCYKEDQQDNLIDFSKSFSILKWVILAVSFGWFIGSMVALFK
jgi:hypothetical protein